jgi:two-component system chemotaxis response regulator CheB
MSAQSVSSSEITPKSQPIKIMIADDSAVIRGLLTRWLSSDAELMIVGTVNDGQSAIDRIGDWSPDIAILDIEMPVMSGLESLPKLLAQNPKLKVIMVSALTTKGANVTLRALELGASDYIPKPEASAVGGAEAFRLELISKIKALCNRSPKPRFAPAPSVPFTPAPLPSQARFSIPQPKIEPLTSPVTPPSPSLIPPSAPTPARRPEAIKTIISGFRPKIPAKILVVGSSTGGPPALKIFLQGLKPSWRLPILIVQHMPAAFTPILAQHLNEACELTVCEAKNDQIIEPGHVYIAPGDFHMTIKGTRAEPIIALDQKPVENFCRPAVDPLFRSAASLFGGSTLGVVLTGMGSDGCLGARSIRDSGGRIYVQDQETSIVWGMPGAIAEAGLADLIKPLPDLADACRTSL